MLNFQKTLTYQRYCTSYHGRGLFVSPLSRCVLAKQSLDIPGEALDEIQKSWDETEIYNESVKYHNDGIREGIVKQVEEFCFDLGLPTWAKDPTGHRIIGEHAEFKTMLKQVDIQMGDGAVMPVKPVPFAVHSLNEDIIPHVKTETLREFVSEVKPLVLMQEEAKEERDAAIVAQRERAKADGTYVAPKRHRYQWGASYSHDYAS